MITCNSNGTPGTRSKNSKAFLKVQSNTSPVQRWKTGPEYQLERNRHRSQQHLHHPWDVPTEIQQLPTHKTTMRTARIQKFQLQPCWKLQSQYAIPKPKENTGNIEVGTKVLDNLFRINLIHELKLSYHASTKRVDCLQMNLLCIKQEITFQPYNGCKRDPPTRTKKILVAVLNEACPSLIGGPARTYLWENDTCTIAATNVAPMTVQCPRGTPLALAKEI